MGFLFVFFSVCVCCTSEGVFLFVCFYQKCAIKNSSAYCSDTPFALQQVTHITAAGFDQVAILKSAGLSTNQQSGLAFHPSTSSNLERQQDSTGCRKTGTTVSCPVSLT